MKVDFRRDELIVIMEGDKLSVPVDWEHCDIIVYPNFNPWGGTFANNSVVRHCHLYSDLSTYAAKRMANENT